jgi:5-methyltetrahydrofolate corrinoid/iron sulfur protein methyltransferase
MLSDLVPRGKSTCGLSNVSNGAPGSRRGLLNRTYLVMLKRYGLYSVIANAFDDELRAIARGELPEIDALVYKVMDGEEIDLSGLSREEAGYVKTARVLLGESIYSDSWLEV